jgi:hypothetical protein
MRALERDPARRFQTSLEFARALESYLSASGLPAGAGDVGEFMQTLFADQIAMRDEVLRAGARLAPLEELVAVWQGSSPTPPPPPPPPEDDFEEVPSEAVTAPRGEHELNDESEAIPLTRSADDGPRTVYVASKSSRRAEGGSLGALFGAALAVVTLALVYLVLRPRPTPVRRAAVPTPVGRAPLRAPPRPATPPAVHDPLPTPAPPRVAVPTPTPPTAPRRPRPATTVQAMTSPPAVTPLSRPGYLSFTSTPAADVYEGDRILGVTPLLDRAVPPGPHSFRFVLRDGSAARSVNVDVQPGASSLVNVNWHPHGDGEGADGGQLP